MIDANTTKKSPLISVLVCNYNYGGYIKETLDSILKQTYKNIEIVVVDDGSTDSSVEVVEKYIKDNPGTKIRLRAKKKNQGICYARNDAIDLAKGEFILFLDSDDTLPKDYIARMSGVANRESADVVYGDMCSFGGEVGDTNFPKFDIKKLLLYNYVNITSLARKSKIGKHRFDTALNRKTLEDYDFWLGLALKGLKFVKAEGVYLNYRVQKRSRNDNSASVRTRIINFLDAWTYSINKYRNEYTEKIPNDIELQEARYRILEIDHELTSLNDIVQGELIPELDRRESHIVSLDGRIYELERENATMRDDLEKIRSSKVYKIYQKVRNRTGL